MRPVGAKPPHQRPGVDAFHADDASAGPGSRPARRRRGSCCHAAAFADDEAGQVRLAAFHVLGVDAVVADLGVGHRDDLAAVARIGEDLLVAGHRGVETDLAVDLAVGAEGCAGEDGSVFQGEFCNVHRCLYSLAVRVAAGVTSLPVTFDLRRRGARRRTSARAASALKFRAVAGPIGFLRLWVSGEARLQSLPIRAANKRVLAPASKGPLFFCRAPPSRRPRLNASHYNDPPSVRTTGCPPRHLPAGGDTLTRRASEGSLLPGKRESLAPRRPASGPRNSARPAVDVRSALGRDQLGSRIVRVGRGVLRLHATLDRAWISAQQGHQAHAGVKGPCGLARRQPRQPVALAGEQCVSRLVGQADWAARNRCRPARRMAAPAGSSRRTTFTSG